MSYYWKTKFEEEKKEAKQKKRKMKFYEFYQNLRFRLDNFEN